MNNFYKVFFTIYFDYSESKNKTITKFFKSDLDLGPGDFDETINDENIFRLWSLLALQRPLSNLNAEKDFIEEKAINKRMETHRIINLKTLSEVFFR